MGDGRWGGRREVRSPKSEVRSRRGWKGGRGEYPKNGWRGRLARSRRQPADRNGGGRLPREIVLVGLNRCNRSVGLVARRDRLVACATLSGFGQQGEAGGGSPREQAIVVAARNKDGVNPGIGNDATKGLLGALGLEGNSHAIGGDGTEVGEDEEEAVLGKYADAVSSDMTPPQQGTRDLGHLGTEISIGQNRALVQQGDSRVLALGEDGCGDVHVKR